MAASIALRQEEDKGVEVQLLLFESLGGFGKGVREILWKAANLRAAEQADAGPYDSQHNNLITAVMDSAKTESDPGVPRIFLLDRSLEPVSRCFFAIFSFGAPAPRRVATTSQPWAWPTPDEDVQEPEALVI